MTLGEFPDVKPKRTGKRQDRKVVALRSLVREEVKAMEDHPSFSGSSLDAKLDREIDSIMKIRSFLSDYDGDNPILAEMAKQMRETPNWCPTDKQQALYLAVRRRMDGPRLSPVSPLEAVLRAQDEDGPTSLDA